jgi:hypothetical protein
VRHPLHTWIGLACSELGKLLIRRGVPSDGSVKPASVRHYLLQMWVLGRNLMGS